MMDQTWLNILTCAVKDIAALTNPAKAHNQCEMGSWIAHRRLKEHGINSIYVAWSHPRTPVTRPQAATNTRHVTIQIEDPEGDNWILDVAARQYWTETLWPLLEPYQQYQARWWHTLGEIDLHQNWKNRGANINKLNNIWENRPCQNLANCR